LTQQYGIGLLCGTIILAELTLPLGTTCAAHRGGTRLMFSAQSENVPLICIGGNNAECVSDRPRIGRARTSTDADRDDA
jgi:hypothetical protein